MVIVTCQSSRDGGRPSESNSGGVDNVASAGRANVLGKAGNRVGSGRVARTTAENFGLGIGTGRESAETTLPENNGSGLGTGLDSSVLIDVDCEIAALLPGCPFAGIAGCAFTLTTWAD